MSACTTQTHERLKRPSQWSKLPKLPLWRLSAEDGGPVTLELANCPDCHSTLAVEISEGR